MEKKNKKNVLMLHLIFQKLVNNITNDFRQ